MATSKDFKPIVKSRRLCYVDGGLVLLVVVLFVFKQNGFSMEWDFRENDFSFSAAHFLLVWLPFCPRMFPFHRHSSPLIGFALLLLRCC